MSYIVTLSLSPEAFEIYNKIPRGQRSKIYETALLVLKAEESKIINDIKHNLTEQE